MMEHINYETSTIPATPAASTATPAAASSTKLSTIIFGVFLGNLMTAVLVAGLYALINAK